MKTTFLKMIAGGEGEENRDFNWAGGEGEENRDFNWYGNLLKHTFPLCPTLFTNMFLNLFYKRGLDETNKQEFRKCLLDDCVEMISSNLDAAGDKQIMLDIDRWLLFNGYLALLRSW